MFNRSNPTNPSLGARPEEGWQQRPPQNFSRPQGPPQQGGYDTRMGNSYNSPPPSSAQRAPVGRQMPPQQQHRRGLSSERSMALRPVKSAGGNTYAFGNLVAVSPLDFPDHEDIYLLLNGSFVLTARPNQECRPGEIGLTDAQRTWAGISLAPNEIVQAQIYSPFSQGGQSYLGGVDIEVGFAGRKTVETAYDQEQLAQLFTRTFENQVLSPGQIILMDVKAIPLRLIVKTVQLVHLDSEKQQGDTPTLTDSNSRGILTRQTVMNFYKDARTGINLKASLNRPATNAILQPNFKFEDMGIGGLDAEFSTIFRRAFASRLFPPGLVERMGILHVRGILLHGPPGTGKTLIARQIGKMLNSREPKIINGPEVLNKFVGQSEENIRKVFADAEKEYKEKGDESGLHIIIFDELDAVCKQRGSGAGGGTGVGDSVVNQLLSKLDGVDQLNNILLIGMTNRLDMIDEALLRPGRLEVHVEISLPDEHGRVQILNIHTAQIRKNGLLSSDVNVEALAKRTKNYSGAELSGLVRAACSFAFSRHTEVGQMAKIKSDVGSILVSREDFEHGLDETKPLFGVAEEELEGCIDEGIIFYSETIKHILEAGREDVAAVRSGSQLVSTILHGPPGSGKTALAARLALDSDFPFIKLISPKDMIGFGEAQKVAHMEKIFRDADKSPLSIVVVDDLEYILDWVAVGPRFSNVVLSNLRSMLTKRPPKNRRRFVLATTAERSVLDQLNILERIFTHQIAVPNISSANELGRVLSESGVLQPGDVERTVELIHQSTGGQQFGVGVKRVLEAVKIAKEGRDPAERCAEILTELMVRSV